MHRLVLVVLALLLVSQPSAAQAIGRLVLGPSPSSVFLARPSPATGEAPDSTPKGFQPNPLGTGVADRGYHRGRGARGLCVRPVSRPPGNADQLSRTSSRRRRIGSGDGRDHWRADRRGVSEAGAGGLDRGHPVGPPAWWDRPQLRRHAPDGAAGESGADHLSPALRPEFDHEPFWSEFGATIS